MNSKQKIMWLSTIKNNNKFNMKLSKYIGWKKLNIKYNIANAINLNDYKYLVSDWSGIFIEFAILTKRRALLINTPKKILKKISTVNISLL